MEEKLQFKTFSEFTQIGDNMETTLKTISFHVIIFIKAPAEQKNMPMWALPVCLHALFMQGSFLTIVSFL